MELSWYECYVPKPALPVLRRQFDDNASSMITPLVAVQMRVIYSHGLGSRHIHKEIETPKLDQRDFM